MIIKKTIYYEIDEDEEFSIYEDFSNYCFMNDMEENYESFIKYYNDTCLEEDLRIVDTEYFNEDDESTIYLLYKKLINSYNKEMVEIEKLEQRKKEIECEYKKIENEIYEIKHRYDIC